MKAIILFLFLIIFSSFINAQKWTSYLVEPDSTSLCNDTVYAIAIDKQGNKWFGTGEGISVFDGTNWKSYNTTNGLINNTVYAIAIDKQGNKWVGTNKGVSVYDGTNWKTYNTTNGLINDTVNAIAIDRQGNKWFGTNGGISVYDGTNWLSYNKTNGLGSDTVNAITIDRQGNKWVGTWGGGVSEFDGTNWKTYNTTNGLDNNDIQSIAIDSLNNKWFGTWGGGVSEFDGTNWKTYQSSYLNSGVWSIAIDRKGNKWVGTWYGIVEFDGTNWTTHATNHCAWAITIDTLNNVWCGTYGGGITEYNGTNWATYRLVPIGLIDNNVQDIAEDSTGTMWFGTGKGVSEFDGNHWITYTTNNGLINDNIITIAVDAQDNKWFGTPNGLSKFDGIHWINYLNGSNINTIAIDKNNNVWAGTNNGLFKFDGTNWTSFTWTNCCPNIIQKIAIINNGMWCGTNTGIMAFNENNSATFGGFYTEFCNYEVGVDALSIDSKGYIWASIKEAPTYMDISHGVVELFSGSNGVLFANQVLPDYGYGSITLDAQNSEWISHTNKNISNQPLGAILTHYNISSNGSIISSCTVTNKSIYNASNGLISNYVNCIMIDNKGNKWFGTSNGVSELQDGASTISADTLFVEYQPDTTLTLTKISPFPINNLIVNSNQSWLTIDSITTCTSGVNNLLTNIYMKASTNTTMNLRTAKVIISGSNIQPDTAIVAQEKNPTVDISNISNLNIRFYPIPVINKLIITSVKQLPKSALFIYSITGQPVYSMKINNNNNNNNNNNISIDMSKYSPGIYVIKLVSNGNIIMTKEVIKK